MGDDAAIGVGVVRNRVREGRCGGCCRGREVWDERGMNWLSVLGSCSMRRAWTGVIVGFRGMRYVMGGG